MMSLISKSVKTLWRASAIAALPLMAVSCAMMADDENETLDPTAGQFINITIGVSAADNPVTRANPMGGEYGDGPEKGLDRENEVTNIAIVFYEDEKGINTTSADTKVIYTANYTATRVTDDDRYHTHMGYEWMDVRDAEILYTTGNRAFPEDELERGKTYHVLAFTNLTDAEWAQLDIKKNDPISGVREKVLAKAFTGTGVGINATSFVMASESDATVKLVNPIYKPYTAATESSAAELPSYTYMFECIHVERLAARLDFWTKNGTYDDETYDHAGYVYKVKERPDDRFVLTSITPFNLYNGNEYLIKRVSTPQNPASYDYLGVETFTNWVYDPNTITKTASAHPLYQQNNLTAVAALAEGGANAYKVTMATVADEAKTTIPGSTVNDNIILGYTQENTLAAGNSLLYYYATGLAIEGYYYGGGETTNGTRCVFYHYLRHQGEKETAYDAIKGADQLDKTVSCPVPNESTGTPAMNFGIVRNNIYRIHVDEVNPLAGWLRLKIAVHDWREVTHPTINM